MSDQPQPQKDFTPAPEYIITDLETVKVLTDPLRLRILENMHEPTTVKAIAAILDKPATKLYYHVNLMEKHGLIVLVDTRVVSGIIEKHYQVAAHYFRIHHSLLSPQQPEVRGVITDAVSNVMGGVREDLITSVHEGVVVLPDKGETPDDQPQAEHVPDPREMLFYSFGFQLTEEQATQLNQRFRQLIQEFGKMSDEAKDSDQPTLPVQGLVVQFPSARKGKTQGQQAPLDEATRPQDQADDIPS